jgi:T-complex protein 1 subunit theta
MAKSMALNQAAGLGGMLKEGHKSFEGLHGAVLRNTEAAKAIAGMVRTSLGPNGMNKLVVNHLEKIIVTSDCATIVKELEVAHPAAKILVLAAEMQQSEYGDYTNFVISFAGELLKTSEDLLKQGLHTAEVVSGFQRAYERTLELLPSMVARTLDNIRDKEQMVAGVKSVISTKQYGYEDLLTDLVCEAALVTMPPTGKPSVNTDSVRIAKIRGGTVGQCTTIKGMVISRDAEGCIKKAVNAKVAVFGCGIEAAATEAKGTVLLKSAEDLLNYNKSEEKKMEETITAIADSGAKVVISHGPVAEMAQHYLDKFGIMVIKVISKFDLRRLCGALGATASIRLGALTPEEMGEVSSCEVVEIAGRKVVKFTQLESEDTSIATIVVRASTEQVANDVERALDDGIQTARTLCQDGRLLPGAGAMELELAKVLKAYADEVKGLDQYGIRKFAESFDVVPRTLAENSGCDPSKTMHKLHASHSGPNTEHMGFDIEECEPFNAVEAGIYDCYASKVNALRLAVDAALTVLRVDQIVMSKPAGGPKPRGM